MAKKIFKLALGSNTNLSDNDYTIEEQAEIYDELLECIIREPRWYLNNLHRLRTFRVGWHDYSTNRTPVPYKYTFYGEKLEKEKDL